MGYEGIKVRYEDINVGYEGEGEGTKVCCEGECARVGVQRYVARVNVRR